MKPSGEILQVSAADYHADTLPTRSLFGTLEHPPTLNVSTARRILQASPLHAREYHPHFGGRTDDAGSAAETGTILHNLILEHGAAIQAVDADDWRTKVARQERARITQAGKIAILKPKIAPLQVIAGVFFRRLESMGINFAGESEVTIRWAEMGQPGNHQAGNILCRGRLDRLQLENGFATIFDLKTTGQSAHPDDWARTIIDRCYDVQAAAYTRAVEAAYPDLAGRVRFVFLVLELEPPYDVAAYELSGAFQEHGSNRWQRAVTAWHRCLSTGNWPGYNAGAKLVTLDPPQYAISREREISYAA